jgi:hypothetical protein
MGYFYKIAQSDIFVILDDVQYPQNSVANRNKIKSNDGKEILLTVPVLREKNKFLNYNQIKPDYKQKWNIKHLKSIQQNYSKAPFFKRYFPKIEDILTKQYNSLAELNSAFILFIIKELEIITDIYFSSQIKDNLGVKNERLINICKYFNSSIYLSGTGAKKYNDENLFLANNINLIYSDFQHPTYEQINNKFISHLSILDVLFNCGKEETNKFLKK